MDLYTKNGRPLQVDDDMVYSMSGRVVGRIDGDRVYGANGRYVGTIDDDRLVYRSNESVFVSAPFNTANIVGRSIAHVPRSTIWGDEPNIPD